MSAVGAVSPGEAQLFQWALRQAACGNDPDAEPLYGIRGTAFSMDLDPWRDASAPGPWYLICIEIDDEGTVAARDACPPDPEPEPKRQRKQGVSHKKG